MNARIFGLVSLAILLAGCVGPVASVEDSSGVTAVQFADVPVPAGMRLIAGHESHSFQVGDFRHGDFHYSGSVPRADVASYMTRRMALHGWSQVGEAPPDAGILDLKFARHPHTARCEIWQESSVTHLRIAVRTETSK